MGTTERYSTTIISAELQEYIKHVRTKVIVYSRLSYQYIYGAFVHTSY